jgi:uncharacterized protein involved in exopolysaccharide biosynthesis
VRPPCRLQSERESALQQLRAQLSGSADEQVQAWRQQQAALEQQLQQLQEALAGERSQAQQLHRSAGEAQVGGAGGARLQRRPARKQRLWPN